MSEPVLAVEHLWKKFCRGLKRSLWYGVRDLAREAFAGRGPREELRKDEFWALRDLSFELRPGETLGLIGHNGAGKSTLLKLINGLIRPDTGRIEVRGRVGALIALGAGFSPVLTGRENIYVNAAVLGLNKREVDARLDRIVDFAEVGDFIDAPLRSYSSGMKVRLGFSVAANLNPDLLLIDEVLSVGDASFRERCLRRLDEYRDRGGSVIFVSHNTAAVEAVSDRVLWLDHGQVDELGDPTDVIQRYEVRAQELSRRADARLRRSAPAPGGALSFGGVTCRDSDGREAEAFDFGESIRIVVPYETRREVRDPHFLLGLKKGGREGPFVLMANTLWNGVRMRTLPPSGVVACTLRDPALSPGTYRVFLGVQAQVSARLGEKWYVRPVEVANLAIRPGRLKQLYPGAPAAVLVSRLPPLVAGHTWTLDGRTLAEVTPSAAHPGGDGS
jgi:lipopolysaccharide transport system ATP-binding protein